MRGDEQIQDGMFSYTSLEQGVPLIIRCEQFANPYTPMSTHEMHDSNRLQLHRSASLQ